MSSRRLRDFLYKHIFKTSSRHLQDILPRHVQGVFQNVFKTRRLPDVFETPHIKTFSRRLKNILKTCFGHLQDVLPRHVQDVFQSVLKTRRLRDVFKIYHQVKLFLLTGLQDVFKTFFQDVFNTFSRRIAKKIIYRKIRLDHTSEKFMVRA